MKRLNNIWGIFLCCFMASLAFTSCGDDVYYITPENTDENLCNKLWITDYTASDGSTGTYQLRFYTDGKGQEVTKTGGTGDTFLHDREINWRWVDDSRECLQWSYADGTVCYMDNVLVRQHYLTGEVDGQQMTFIEANYQH